MTSHARRGRELELSIARAARLYCTAGRAMLLRQHIQRSAEGIHVSRAPLDFIGLERAGRQARPLALEVKQHAGAALPLSAWPEPEREAAQTWQQLGGIFVLIIEFTDHGEALALPWEPLGAFLAAPWRQSISLDYARAHGLLLPLEGGPGKERVLFLDGKPHSGVGKAIVAVEADKERARLRPARDFGNLDLLDPPPAPRERLTVDEAKRRIESAMAEGIANASKRARSGWRGGR